MSGKEEYLGCIDPRRGDVVIVTDRTKPTVNFSELVDEYGVGELYYVIGKSGSYVRLSKKHPTTMKSEDNNKLRWQNYRDYFRGEGNIGYQKVSCLDKVPVKTLKKFGINLLTLPDGPQNLTTPTKPVDIKEDEFEKFRKLLRKI